MNKEMVNHPSHYQSKSGLEVIDVIDAFTDGLKGGASFDAGNMIKYACRWHSKGAEVQDLKKVIWYAEHLIGRIEKGEEYREGHISSKEEAENAINSIINYVDQEHPTD